jgi:multidrug efflux pump subunit AcrB
MKLSDLSIKRPVLAVVMSLLLLVLGVMSFMRLTLRELPAIDPPIVSVQVNYPGASASVVETRITQTLEDALAGIEGINTIESRSVNGASRVSIEFLATRDIEAAANDVRDAVSRVADRMPEEADPPEISKVESDADPIIWLNMRSANMDTLQLSDYAERYVVDRFSSLEGVAQVRLGGEPALCDADLAERRQAGRARTDRGDVESALRAENVELGAGRIESTDRDFILRVARDYTTAPRRSRRCRSPRAATATWCAWATWRRWHWSRPSAVPTTTATASRRRHRHRQDLDREQPGRGRGSQGRGRADQGHLAGRHRHLRRLRHHHLHRGRWTASTRPWSKPSCWCCW